VRNIDLKKFIKSSDSGESLLEVVVSAVILSLIGLLLVTSISTAKPFADKMSLMGESVSGLNTAAEAINLQSFAHCVPGNNEPYSLSVPVNSAITSINGFAITTTEIPPVLVGSKKNFNFQIQVQNAPGALNWTVEPPLPLGLSLDSNSGVISGKSDSAITAQYTFVASNGAVKATKILTLPQILVEVQENNGTAWVDCGAIAIDAITAATGDGSVSKYLIGNGLNIFKGNLVSVWGSSNNTFDGTTLYVSDSNSNVISTQSTTKGTSVSGFVGLSKQVDLQQVVLSTIVSGNPLKKIIVKSAA
jgi:type II secretory pathway pseudopilin PulG